MEDNILKIDDCFFIECFNNVVDVEFECNNHIFTSESITKEKAKEIIEFLTKFIGEE